MKRIFLLFVCVLVRQSSGIALDETCFFTQTCSPAACKKVSNAACASEKSTIDVAAAAAAIPCSQCTQSTNPICSQLGTVLKGTGIKVAYCTDKFIVIHSDNEPNHVDSLSNIPRPPGGGGSGGYDTQCVTRTREVQFLSFKIPLATTELPSAAASNNLGAFPDMTPVAYLENKVSGEKVGLPVAGPCAMSVTGLPIFPPYNNQGTLTWESCEIDHCNTHVGKGFDYHYHGDPFGDLCMYSAKDYTSIEAHPPLIGWGLDGFKIYGRRLSASAPGSSIPLDDCGGHTHDTFGYHYHSQVKSMTGGTVGNYTAYIAGPYKCWKGDISKIEQFWNKDQAAYGSGRMSPSNLHVRPDYELLKPCCGGIKYTSFGTPATKSDASTITGKFSKVVI